MKKILCFTVCICILQTYTQAQLLKKLKDKAAQALEGKPAATDKTTGSTEKQDNTGVVSKQKIKWIPAPGDEKQFTLEAGEILLYDETMVYVAENKLNTAFIVMGKGYNYFLIENGKRSGPYKNADVPLKELGIKSAKKNEEDAEQNNENTDDKIEIGSNNRDAVAQQYSKTINSKLHIVFNGKTFGPYDYIAKMKVSPDKKKFWAAVTIGGQSDMMAKMGMGNNFLVNESGVKIATGKSGAVPVKMMVSSAFGAAALTVMNTTDQKIMIVSSTGKNMESSIMDAYGSNGGGTSVADNGDIVSVPAQSPTQLLVNGNEAASFTVPVKNMNLLFIVPGYKNSVYFQKGKLYRGDGTEENLSGVLFPKVVTINKQTALYYYKIHETENGTNDVYLVKKAL